MGDLPHWYASYEVSLLDIGIVDPLHTPISRNLQLLHAQAIRNGTEVYYTTIDPEKKKENKAAWLKLINKNE